MGKLHFEFNQSDNFLNELPSKNFDSWVGDVNRKEPLVFLPKPYKTYFFQLGVLVMALRGPFDELKERR